MTLDLVWGLGWRGNTGFPGTAYCVGGKSIYWGGWCPRLQPADLAQWPEDVRRYLTSPPDFGNNLPNRLPSSDRESVYEAVEYEIGVKPADDYVFDPIEGPNEPPGRIGLNDALEERLKAALAALRQRPGGTPFADEVDPPRSPSRRNPSCPACSPPTSSAASHC
jgi:choline dehydrogenase-like flavoprotein